MKITQLTLASTLVASTCLVSASAWAAPTTLNASEVDIGYDQEWFALEVETLSFGSKVMTPISGYSASVSGISNGVEINFNDYLQASASAGTTFNSESYKGNFSIPLSFTAHTGYKIDSYTITYSGIYSISNAAGVYAGGTGTAFSENVYAAPGKSNAPFSVSATIAGATLPTITGSFEAAADYGTTQVFDGSTWEYSHSEYEETCDALGVCTTTEIPIYEEVLHYHEEGLIGDANINLSSIRITANVAPVPEPETYAMLLAGLGILASVRRRAGKRKE